MFNKSLLYMPNPNHYNILSISIFCKIPSSISIFSRISLSMSICCWKCPKRKICPKDKLFQPFPYNPSWQWGRFQNWMYAYQSLHWRWYFPAELEPRSCQSSLQSDCDKCNPSPFCLCPKNASGVSDWSYCLGIVSNLVSHHVNLRYTCKGFAPQFLLPL